MGTWKIMLRGIENTSSTNSMQIQVNNTFIRNAHTSIFSLFFFGGGGVLRPNLLHIFLSYILSFCNFPLYFDVVEINKEE